MTLEIGLALALLLACVILFTTDKYSPDVVAMMGLGAALLIGLVAQSTGWINTAKWLTLSEGLSGFSDPALITIGAMFVLSAGLQKTGAMAVASRTLIRAGRNRLWLVLVVMLTVGSVSAFMNNTAAVAVFLPVVLMACARHKISASRVLIPLAFASQFGGVCTLIGTSTNLVVSSIAVTSGLRAFEMFEFGRLGVILMGVGILYLLVVGRWLLPERRGPELTEAYQLREYITELRVGGTSPLLGKTVRELRLGTKHDVTVLEILRGRHKIWSPQYEPIRADDVLLVRGLARDLMALVDQAGLAIEPEFKLKDATLSGRELTLVETLVAPRSRLAGRTLSELGFHGRYGAIVLAMQRQGHLLRDKLSGVRLRFGDALLLLIPRDSLSQLRATDQLIMLGEVETSPRRGRKAWLALAIVASVVALAALEVMPILYSALIGSVVMLWSRCLTVEQAYEAIDWRVIFLLAGVLPLGQLLKNTGGAVLLAEGGLDLVGPFGPVAVLAMLYAVTALLTAFLSNNASALLLAPIAIQSAQDLGVDPKPFLMAVAFAASTCFATPVGYQTNAMVQNAGGYRFTDFMRVGIPLNLLFGVVAVWLIPRFWPFG